MKNDFCDLPPSEIRTLPERFLGFLLSPFQFAKRDGYVCVPEETFKEMIDIITEYAIVKCDEPKPPDNPPAVNEKAF